MLARPHETQAGNVAILSGYIASSRQSCNVHQRVNVLRRIHGTPNFGYLRKARTDSRERYQLSLRVHKSADYKVVVPSSASCLRATSNRGVVLVRVHVEASASDTTPQQGTTDFISGFVKPDHPGTTVVLQRRTKNGWMKVQNPEKLLPDSSFHFAIYVSWTGKRAFRVRWVKSDFDHESGASDPVVLTAHV